MEANGPEGKRAAVVIPLKNESRELEELLTALARQLGKMDEVICVDTGSTDGTWEILCNFAAAHPQFKVVREEGACPGRARNIAINQTTAHVIAQIDGGNWPHAHWLQALLAPLIADRADYVIGDVAVKPIIKTFWGHQVDMSPFYGASLFRGKHIRGRELHPPAGGASVAYKRRVWERAGGLPEWLYTGEDRLFAQKLDQQELRIVFEKNAKIYWEIGPTLRDFLRRHAMNQRRKASRENTLHSPWKGFLIQAGFMVGAVATLFQSSIWPLPVIIFYSAVFHQTLKSVRTYLHRHGNHQEDTLVWIVSQFLAIESLVFPSKLMGSIKAILRSDKDQLNHRKQKKDYLAP